MSRDKWATRYADVEDTFDALVPDAPWAGAYALLWHQPPALYIGSLLKGAGITVPQRNHTAQDMVHMGNGRMAYRLAVLRWAVDLHRSWVVWYEGKTGPMTADLMAAQARRCGWTAIHHAAMPDQVLMAGDQVIRHHFYSIMNQRTDNVLGLMGMEETWTVQMLDRLTGRR